MTQLMLNAYGGDFRNGASRRASNQGKQDGVECYHVDARLSSSLDDIGRARKGKVFRILKYSLEAVWCRLRYNIESLYYVPAPGNRVPLYRDWIVMTICRPFFRKIIFHTHAVGLGSWLEKEARPWERFITRRLLGGVDLNICLSEYYRPEVMKLTPKRVEVVPIGIPDPCPDFESRVFPQRLARVEHRRELLGEGRSNESAVSAEKDGEVFRVLFVGMCHREKGLFDVLEAVALFHQKLLKEKSPIRVRLDVVGKFFEETDRREFDTRIKSADLQSSEGPIATYHGFVDTKTKYRLFGESDCFCFPTYYQAEGQPATLVEALAFGLPIVTTRWRAIPDLFEADYPGLVDVRSPMQIAEKFERFLSEYPATNFREKFRSRFTEEHYIKNLKTALETVE
jgi:glycosyltransferase involved in cell wall biosynthesis